MKNNKFNDEQQKNEQKQIQGDGNMPTMINIIEQERNSYIDGMAQYLEKLKRMPDEQIRRHSEKVLVEAEIIDNSGNLINYREHKSTRFVKGKL